MQRRRSGQGSNRQIGVRERDLTGTVVGILLLSATEERNARFAPTRRGFVLEVQDRAKDPKKGAFPLRRARALEAGTGQGARKEGGTMNRATSNQIFYWQPWVSVGQTYRGES